MIAFFLCWAPFHAQRLLYLYANDFPNFPEINEWMYHVAGIFYYISSTVNPILYNVMSAKYRLAFKKTLCGFVQSRKASNHRTNFTSINQLDHSFTYFPSEKQQSRSLQRSKKGERSVERLNHAKDENHCENDDLIRKPTKRDSIKTGCNVVVVITPNSKKVFRS